MIPSRQLGTLGITDVLVVVLFAEAAQNAMATNYTSITEGAILVSTVIFKELLPQLDCLLFSTAKALFKPAAFAAGEEWSFSWKILGERGVSVGETSPTEPRREICSLVVSLHRVSQSRRSGKWTGF